MNSSGKRLSRWRAREASYDLDRKAMAAAKPHSVRREAF